MTQRSPNVTWHDEATSRDERWSATGTRGATVWLTGLSGSGKSTIAVEVSRMLVARGLATYSLDGNNLRHCVNGVIGFSANDRTENIRRFYDVALFFADAGVFAVV